MGGLRSYSTPRTLSCNKYYEKPICTALDPADDDIALSVRVHT